MSKRSVNIINFVRGCDPRPYSNGCDLLGSFKKELALTKEYGVDSTILMCYDALVQDEFIETAKTASDNTEFGIWFEVTKPLCDKLNIFWSYHEAWDWHINPSFLMAYTLEERGRMIDEAFECFKEKFGYFPRVVGSWMLDAFSLKYMADKYEMDAFIYCREQFGVDAYTLWGGYYNGAYYPSKKNMFIPAKSKENTINVPTFRMLGIDPCDAYDDSYTKHSVHNWGPRTLEPAWPTAQDENWVKWYFKNFTENEDLGFSYTQTGQENSFGYEKGYGKALKMHIEHLLKLEAEGKVTIETLGKSGKWFSKNYKTTPATVYSNLDYSEEGHDSQSVWYSCVNYRANIFSFDGELKIRDIGLFDENYKEYYSDNEYKGSTAAYYSYPVVDGFLWSDSNKLSGLYFDKKGKITKTEKFGDTLKAFIEFENESKGELLFKDFGLEVTAEEPFTLTLECDRLKAHQFEDVYKNTVNYRQDGNHYEMNVTLGEVSYDKKLILTSVDNKLVMDFALN